MNILEMNSKAQEINTSTLTVKDNIISFTNYFIQIRNISEAEIAPVPSLPYPIIAIIICLIGFIMTCIGIGHYVGITVVGILFFAVGVMPLYMVYKKNQDRGEVLILGLNSGKRFYFKCKDRAFLARVLEVLKACVNKNMQNVIVDFSNSVITNSPIVGGNNNKVEVEA